MEASKGHLNTKAPRNLNVEVLRILAMFLIVLGHSITHSHLMAHFSGGTHWLIQFISVVSSPATDCFVLITGYFQSRTSFKMQKCLWLWLQVFFYSVFFYIVFIVCGRIAFRPNDCMKVLLPISSNQYWFLRVFIGLYILSPFLNRLVDALEKAEFQRLLLLNLVLFSLWRSFIPFATTLNNEGGNSIIWFVVLYLTGAYLAKYPVKISRRWISTMLVIFILFAWGSIITISLASKHLGFGGKGASLFSEFTSFPIYGSAVCLLLLVVKQQACIHDGILRRMLFMISSSTLSVYLIHEHPLVRRFLWEKLNLPSISMYMIIPAIVGMSIVIFIVCVIIDQLTWQPFSKLVKRHQKRI